MKRHFTIEGITKKQAEAIKLALEDKQMVAFLIIVGTVKPLKPSAQRRVLTFVADQIADED